ncbi:hypothetical protein EV182_000232 [Spiromyces aspiralis]|uniref:Uncharacterized protein n=1 Tax=Spiromyces aspiralis TaxID=68401 RepID=A0ACC1HYI4_9FUNG|nr:hypothetical protein EV182_000232 [Spiromyces aspiralis]
MSREITTINVHYAVRFTKFYLWVHITWFQDDKARLQGEDRMWEYQRWKARCEAQIDREEGSQISPETRRCRMRMEQPTTAAGGGPQADGIPERVQRTIRGREAEFKRWCTDRWRLEHKLASVRV